MQDNENMDSENKELTVSKPSTRRTFMKKAAVGATIASIPAHSAWAGRLISGNLSGNVSGWDNGTTTLAIYSHGQFKTGSSHQYMVPNRTWSYVFGAGRDPFKESGSTVTIPNSLTLQQFIDNNFFDNDKNKPAGPNDINMQLVTMYVNALNNGSGTVWPVVENGLFINAEEYAKYLWDQANRMDTSPSAVSDLLKRIIDDHHI
jgi:hypothetical protein